jgi:hypothetical protein
LRGSVHERDQVLTRHAASGRNTNEALSNRIDALDVLAEAAVALSALPDTAFPPTAPSFAAPSPLPQAQHVGGGCEHAGAYDIYHPSSGKTRRWSDRSKVRKAAVGVNEFGELLEVFFFALVGGMHDAQASARLLGVDFVLLGRVVATLGVYIECACNSPAARVAAKSLVAVLRHASLRHHQQPFVRRCVHFALTRVLIALPQHVFLADYADATDDLQQWLTEACNEDPDEEVARLAMFSRATLSNHLVSALPKICVLGE